MRAQYSLIGAHGADFLAGAASVLRHPRSRRICCGWLPGAALCIAAVSGLALTQRPSHITARKAGDARLELAEVTVQRVPEVLFTVTSCTACHQTNFEQLVSGVESVLKYEASRLAGTVIVNEVLPVGHKINWTEKAATRLPGARFVQKEGPDMHGQARSLNLILQIVRDSSAKYFLHWEESWALLQPAINDALTVLEKYPDILVVQIEQRPDVTCQMDGPACIAQPDSSYRSKLLTGCEDHVYAEDRVWPLFTLHPSLNRASASLLSVMFNESSAAWPVGFELEWACSLLRQGGGFAYLNRSRVVKDGRHVPSWVQFPAFADVDANRDNRVSRGELDSYVDHLVAGWSSNGSKPRLPYMGRTNMDYAPAAPLAMKLRWFATHSFDSMDRDGDGVLTHSEGWLLPQ